MVEVCSFLSFGVADRIKGVMFLTGSSGISISQAFKC